MALFFEHIKGINVNTDDTDSRVYSWIEFVDNSTDYAPILKTGTSANKNAARSYGSFILSGTDEALLEQNLYSNFYFHGEDCTISWNGIIGGVEKQVKIVGNPTSIEVVNGLESNKAVKIDFNTDKITFSGLNFASSGDFTINAPNYEFNGTGVAHFQGTLKTDKKCEALYFNTTSDRRAKKNVEKANFNALLVVNALPVYSFNYKKDNILSIGLIAQQVSEFPLDHNFNLVDNIEASGENEDYMSIKESKLVYVLWKAIQEQQKQINELENKLKQLLPEEE